MNRVYTNRVLRFWAPAEWALAEKREDSPGETHWLFVHGQTGKTLGVMAQPIPGEEEISDQEALIGWLMDFPHIKNSRARPVALSSGLVLASFEEDEGAEISRICDFFAPTHSGLYLLRFVVSMTLEEWRVTENVVNCHLVRRTARQSEVVHNNLFADSSPDWLSKHGLGFTLPDEIAGMFYDFATDYEAYSPGEGMGFRYRGGDGLIVDLYIYNHGLDYLEEGICHEARLELEQTSHTLRDMYSRVSRDFAGEMVIDHKGAQRRFLHHRFKVFGDDPADGFNHSHALITVHKSHFVKLRCSFPAGAEQDMEQFEMFVRGLTELLEW